ncbi:MAG: 50S ribosomal protein L15 [Termitinemataceae bacterium]|jgi:large subunit ribosomal protein L15|nr:MAG: 50S ribosomal protein L15 [Termitinemataceae bacterium]
MHSFDLHAPEGANKRKRIVGRGQGSGRGGTAGKGNKGQQSRSGGKTYLGFEGGQMPLYRRIAHRGFSNYPFKKEYQIVNIGEIDARFEQGDTVDVPSLYLKGLVKGNTPVKILGSGELTKSLTVNIASLSGSAKEKIIKAGGSIAEVEEKSPGTGKKAKRKAKTVAAAIARSGAKNNDGTAEKAAGTA